MSEQKKTNSYTYLLIALIAALVIKVFIFDILHISGESMENAIHDGDTVYVNRLAYGLKNPFSESYLIRWNQPQKNDVVTFHHDNKVVIKRCVLTAGDSMEIFNNSKYNLIIGGEKIPITEETAEWIKSNQIVPEGFIFVLGDTPDSSVDSRDYGFVGIDSITGRILGK